MQRKQIVKTKPEKGNFFLRNSNRIKAVGACAALLVFFQGAFATGGPHYFSPAFTSIQTHFGASSDFWKILILIEVVVAVVAYITKKNPMVFVGVVIISLFINVALALVFG